MAATEQKTVVVSDIESPIFSLISPGNAPVRGAEPRVGRLMGMETPAFTVLTGRGFPLTLRPEVNNAVLPGTQLMQLPVGDLVARTDSVSQCPAKDDGCKGFWPHLKGHVSYCSFRDPRKDVSVYGGDSVCSVETTGGRQKVGPQQLLDLQKVMKMDLVAAPAEEVPIGNVGQRRIGRSVGRAADWLKEILEAKNTDPELKSFEWNVLAGIQGSGDIAYREKACLAAASTNAAGFWIGGLGYGEDLSIRGRVLEAVGNALPTKRPRFLPLKKGSPVEVLQAVLLGVDVVEVTFPTQMATSGYALTFEWEMPKEELEKDKEVAEEGLKGLEPETASDTKGVRHLNVRDAECRENFGPITASSPVKQYSRAYVHHLQLLHELFASMLLTQHNLHVYREFFAAIRSHIQAGTFRQYAAWFMRTQTVEDEAPNQEPKGKRRKI
mmetsp:Transcript_59743/g.131166  ORF Transcript_59743/g.131166 Transcript_59743/m.131166 type:complete len:439 (-) Transcript_59743:38-1354(-)